MCVAKTRAEGQVRYVPMISENGKLPRQGFAILRLHPHNVAHCIFPSQQHDTPICLRQSAFLVLATRIPAGLAGNLTRAHMAQILNMFSFQCLSCVTTSDGRPAQMCLPLLLLLLPYTNAVSRLVIRLHSLPFSHTASRNQPPIFLVLPQPAHSRRTPQTRVSASGDAAKRRPRT